LGLRRSLGYRMWPEEHEQVTGQVRIGAHVVGAAQRVLIIAEAGVNHDGNCDDALRLVDAAAAAGADVVKFQMFRTRELVTGGAEVAAYQQACGAASQQALLERLELDDAAFARIAEHCRAQQIMFLATPFSPGDVGRLVQLDTPAIKIASTDLNNTPLLQRAATTGLPLIVSTGAATRAEIAATASRLRAWNAGARLVLLHCISGYPTPLAAANLRAIAAKQSAFDVPCGFSDHTESIAIAGWAVAAGACVLEKHFTLDRSRSGPDHAMSLDPVQLREYVAAARAAEVALGDGTIGMLEVEADVRTHARRSVVAARPIAAGTVLTPDLLAVKRPAGGIAPDAFAELLGRTVAADIAADTPLMWDMIR
jgi:N,N'-diacetyllegionaminate synthase